MLEGGRPGVLLVVSAGGGGVCRLCLCAHPRLLADIFPPAELEPTQPLALHDQIRLLTGLHISSDDELPQKVCYKCRYLVELSYELRETAVRADSLLSDATLYLLPDNSNQAVELIDDKGNIMKFQQNESPQDESHKRLLSMLEESESFGSVNKLHSPPCSQLELIRPADVSQESLANTEDSLSKDVKPHGIGTRKNTYSKAKFKWKPAESHGLTCQICLTTLSSKEKLTKHVKRHYEGSELTPYTELKRPYRCNSCGQELPNKIQMHQHHRKHLDVNPFVCRHPGCSFVGDSREKLRQHGYSHRARSYVCDSCGASFRRSFDLKRHFIRHADDGAAFPCRRCRVVCSNRITYRNHVKTHELGRRFKCERAGCPKAFFSRADLMIHQHSHENKRFYRCHLCVSSYNSQSLLNRHLRLHQKLKTNKCDKCSETFNNYAAFYNHRVSTHGPWQPHKCPGCNQGYQSEMQLEKHMSRCQLAINMKMLHSRTSIADKSSGILTMYVRQDNQICQDGALTQDGGSAQDGDYTRNGSLSQDGDLAQNGAMTQVSALIQDARLRFEGRAEQEDVGHAGRGGRGPDARMDTMEEMLIRNLKGHIVKANVGATSDDGVDGLLYVRVEDGTLDMEPCPGEEQPEE